MNGYIMRIKVCVSRHLYVISIGIIIVNRQDFERQGDKEMVVNESMYQLGSSEACAQQSESFSSMVKKEQQLWAGKMYMISQ